MSENPQGALLAELQALLAPIVGAATSPERAFALFRELGWDMEELLGSGTAQLLSDVAAIARLVQKIGDWVTTPPESLPELTEALGTVHAAVAAIGNLPAAAGTIHPPALDQLAGELVDVLVTRYLAERKPAVLDVLTLLGLTTEQTLPAVIVPATPPPPALPTTPARQVRAQTTLTRFDLPKLYGLATDPVGTLKQRWARNGLATQADADAVAEALFPPLARLLGSAGMQAGVGRGSSLPELDDAAERAIAHVLTAAFAFTAGEVSGLAGAEAKLLPASDGGPGVFILPFGELELTHGLPGWLLSLQLAGGVGGFLAKRTGVELVQGTGVVAAAAAIQKLASGGVAFRLGSTTGTRLEVGLLRLSAGARLTATAREYGSELTVDKAALVVAARDGDGFLRKILPPDGLRTEFDLGIGWSTSKGLYFRGAASLDATVPVHQSLGPITIDSVFLAVRATQSGIPVEAGLSATVRLGPVAAAISRVGVKADLTFPPGGGNLGPAELTPAFRKPTGIALEIKAGTVVGGGFLDFDPVAGRYAGGVHLEAGGLRLSAVGLLTTRMPDGSPGFSLLVLISTEFPGIALGFGFTLNGVGGLLGVNRTAVVTALRSGIRDGSAGRLLFPRDPVGDANQLLAGLGTLFPPVQGRYVLGPMVKLGWGTPTVLTLELGLLLELPAPVRLYLLGRLTLTLPKQQGAVVTISLDALGAIDLDRGEVALDAVLYESKLAGFPLTGAMALRARWRDQPTFALAIGGFHPRFQPPQGFPELERVALALAVGDSPRLRMEVYLALTSNSVQFGARIEMYAAYNGVTFEGLLTFDALFHFSPFGFEVDVTGMFALKSNGRVLCAVAVELVLSGPSPWHARGHATFELFGVSTTIPFDQTFGVAAVEPPPAPIDVSVPLIAALKDPANWSTELPAADTAITAQPGPPAAGQLLAHPSGRLSVHQRVVPLGVQVDRVGQHPVAGGRRFDITKVTLGSTEWARRSVDDWFAPGEFLVLSDAARLARPSYELFQAGVACTLGAGLSFDADGQELTLTERFAVIDAPSAPSQPLSGALFDGAAATASSVEERLLQFEIAASAMGTSPAALAATRASGTARFQAPALGIALTARSWVVASTDTLTIADPRPAAGERWSYTVAAERLAAYLQTHQALRDHLHVIPSHEVT